MRSSNGALIAGVGILALAFAAVTYLFGVGPRLDAASDARQNAEIQQSQNEILELELLKRQADFERLPEYKERIYEIRDDFPEVLDIPNFTRTLDTIFKDNKLAVLKMDVGSSQALNANVDLSRQFAQVGLSSNYVSRDVSNVVATSVTMNFVGTRDRVFSAISDMQFGDHRYVLPTALNISAISEAGNQSGIAVKKGDVSVELVVMIFTLDAGNDSIQTRPVVPDCIEPPADDDGATAEESGTDVSVEDENADEETESLPVCSEESSPSNPNIFNPLS